MINEIEDYSATEMEPYRRLASGIIRQQLTDCLLARSDLDWCRRNPPPAEGMRLVERYDKINKNTSKEKCGKYLKRKYKSEEERIKIENWIAENRIILKRYKTYKKMLYLKKQPDYKKAKSWLYKKSRAEKMIVDAELFFKSDWCEELAGFVGLDLNKENAWEIIKNISPSRTRKKLNQSAN